MFPREIARGAYRKSTIVCRGTFADTGIHLISLSPYRRWLLWLLLLSAVICVCFPMLQRSSFYRNHLYVQLLSEDSHQQLKAASVLAYLGAEEELLRALQTDKSSARDLGQRALEHLWFRAAGNEAYEMVETAHNLAQTRDAEKALGILSSLVEKYPKYAEGWNQRASLHWQMGAFEESIADSIKALRLNPHHYGAWQGLGMCYLKMGMLYQASACFRAALKILPFDTSTREALRKCDELLNENESPLPRKRSPDLVANQWAAGA